MTTKQSASNEQEAIASIKAQLKHIESEQGLDTLVESLANKRKVLLEKELKEAKNKVGQLEKKIGFLANGASGKIIEKPDFSKPLLENSIKSSFLLDKSDNFEFTTDMVKTFLIKELELKSDQINYNTSNGNNVFSSAIRSALNRLVNEKVIDRLRPGLFVKTVDYVIKERKVPFKNPELQHLNA